MSDVKSAVILVFNSKNELVLQKRAAGDKSYPLHWDFSAAGGIDPLEKSKEAAIRELNEELGIKCEVQFVGNETYIDNETEDHLYIYCAKYEGPFNLSLDEVQEAHFFSMERIGEMLREGLLFHPEFSFLWNAGTIDMALDQCQQ